MTTDIITLGMATGATSASTYSRITNGRVVGISVFHNHDFNDGRNIVLRASVKDDGGTDIAKLQDVRNLRNREAGYHAGYYPVNLEGGKTYHFALQASEALAADVTADLVFHYE